MEWDRQHSAFLYHFLSGGQPVHKDKLPRKTSPKIEPRTQPNQQHSRIGKQHPPGAASSPKEATSIKNGREENNNKSTLAAIIEQQLPSPRVMALREQELAKDVQSLATAAAERRQEAKLLFIKVCWEIIAWSNEGWVWVALSPLFILLSFFYFDPASVAKVKYLYIMLFVDILLTGGIKFLTKRTRPAYNKVPSSTRTIIISVYLLFIF